MGLTRRSLLGLLSLAPVARLLNRAAPAPVAAPPPLDEPLADEETRQLYDRMLQTDAMLAGLLDRAAEGHAAGSRLR